VRLFCLLGAQCLLTVVIKSRPQHRTGAQQRGRAQLLGQPGEPGGSR
jgi:hypothetical protein